MTEIERQDKELHLINLVSRGVPLCEARERVYGKQPEPATEPTMDEDDVEALRQKLTDAGIPFHHKAGKAKLTALIEESQLL